MSSLSMALAGLGVSIDNAPSNPGSLNAWLEANNGYTCAAGDCNNLVLNAVQRLTPVLKLVGEIEKPPVAEIRANLTSQAQVFIAHVHDRTHFVLLTGWDDDAQAFTVNDPFYNTTVRMGVRGGAGWLCACVRACASVHVPAAGHVYGLPARQTHGVGLSREADARCVTDVRVGFHRRHHHLRHPAAAVGCQPQHRAAADRRRAVPLRPVQAVQQVLGRRHHRASLLSAQPHHPRLPLRLALPRCTGDDDGVCGGLPHELHQHGHPQQEHPRPHQRVWLLRARQPRHRQHVAARQQRVRAGVAALDAEPSRCRVHPNC